MGQSPKLVFQVIGAFGSSNGRLSGRVVAGVRRAVAFCKRIGRPMTDAALLNRAKLELAKGTGIVNTAKQSG
jgi:hypothetical protein